MKQGIHTISAEDYHADPCEAPSLSASLAKILCGKTPAHARLKHPRLTPRTPDQPTPAMDLGTAVHALILQPELAEQLIVVVEANSWRSNAAKDERDSAWANGLTPLLPPAFETATKMADAARIQIEEHSADIFEDGLAEQVLVWQDDGGIWCRSRLDWLRDDHRSVDDLKTTGAGASPIDLQRRVFSDGWDIQAAFYLRGMKALEPGLPKSRLPVRGPGVNPPLRPHCRRTRHGRGDAGVPKGHACAPRLERLPEGGHLEPLQPLPGGGVSAAVGRTSVVPARRSLRGTPAGEEGGSMRKPNDGGSAFPRPYSTNPHPLGR